MHWHVSTSCSQIPLLSLRSRAFVVRISGVRLVAAPRPSADWDQGAL